MKKKYQIVMLNGTELRGEGFAFLDSIEPNKLLQNFPSNIHWKDCAYQHLYVLSDDEVKEGDWFICTKNSCMSKADKGYKQTCLSDKKIIASTNKHLSSPLLSDLFIKIYIAEYNIGKVIEEIELDMEFSHYTPESEQQYIQDLREDPSVLVSIYKPKVNSDNTVIINLIEEKTYTKEQMIKIIRDMLDDEGIKYHYVREWLNEHGY